MKFIAFTFLLLQCLLLRAQNPLYIPPALTGTTFNLNVQSGTKTFYGSTTTPTYGINGVWLAPTIVVNKGDMVTLNVINSLPVKTTMHWHGLHVAAKNDGGPHQIINPSSTWSPSFKILNNAATYWYHPHGAGQTELQVAKGLAGMFIVRDSAEAALPLPRTYGVDDIPLIIQSKAFDELKQLAIASDMDTALFVNGTLNPVLNTPAQVVRFRLLNGSSLRTFNIGLSNGQTFYQVATDGGLLDSAVAHTRLRLSPGERAEILINLSGMTGQNIDVKSYASELAAGIYGAANVGSGADTIHEYQDNFLNGADFNLLRLAIVAPTAGAITGIPAALIPLAPLNSALATVNRTIVLDTIRLLSFEAPNRAEGPFGMNNKSFHMDSINEVVHLNTVEIWTLVNKTLVAHPFHIHDIQFNLLEKNGNALPAGERCWKDVVLVMPNDTVKFITQFPTFADPVVPYMYHCHLLHHEDDGMMGSFLVIDTTTTGITDINMPGTLTAYPNPASTTLHIQTSELLASGELYVLNTLGETVIKQNITSFATNLNISDLANGIYLLRAVYGTKSVTSKILKQ